MYMKILKVGLLYTLKSHTMTVAMYKVIIVIIIIIIIILNIIILIITILITILLLMPPMQVRLLPTDSSSGLYLKTELKRGKQTMVRRSLSLIIVIIIIIIAVFMIINITIIILLMIIMITIIIVIMLIRTCRAPRDRVVLDLSMESR